MYMLTYQKYMYSLPIPIIKFISLLGVKFVLTLGINF